MAKQRRCSVNCWHQLNSFPSLASCTYQNILRVHFVDVQKPNVIKWNTVAVKAQMDLWNFSESNTQIELVNASRLTKSLTWRIMFKPFSSLSTSFHTGLWKFYFSIMNCGAQKIGRRCNFLGMEPAHFGEIHSSESHLKNNLVLSKNNALESEV